MSEQSRGELSFDDLQALATGTAAMQDVACPLCGPKCKSGANQRRKVLRIWDDGDFITYKCARCDVAGWAREARSATSTAPRPKPQPDETPQPDKSELARFLWGKSLPAAGTVVEVYLSSRKCWLPSDSIRFLPGRGEHPPAMISRFDSPVHVTGIHLTKLRSDGQGKAGTDKDKIMIGPSMGLPIIVHENPDRSELFITEGIEDAASLALATGWSAWAAGSAGRISAVLPLARRYEKVFVPMDRDLAGRRAIARSISVRSDIVPLRLWRTLPSKESADANKALIAFGPDVLRAAVEWSDALASHGRGLIGYGAMINATERASAIFLGLAGDGMQ